MQGALEDIVVRYFIYMLRVAIASMVLCLPTVSAGDKWILVDSEKQMLAVMSGNATEQIYRHISLGRGGLAPDRIKGDRVTPIGEYHITRVSADSPFHIFIGLNYPSLDQAMRALQEGVINPRQFGAIRKALQRKEQPPQDTPLGGYIGIHGVGAGDRQIHGMFNWTNGCVALTNEQVDDLVTRVHVGMRVVIR